MNLVFYSRLRRSGAPRLTNVFNQSEVQLQWKMLKFEFVYTLSTLQRGSVLSLYLLLLRIYHTIARMNNRPKMA